LSLAIARYTNTEVLDSSFGASGDGYNDIWSEHCIELHYMFQASSKIVTVENARSNVQQSFVNNIVVARYSDN